MPNWEKGHAKMNEPIKELAAKVLTYMEQADCRRPCYKLARKFGVAKEAMRSALDLLVSGGSVVIAPLTGRSIGYYAAKWVIEQPVRAPREFRPCQHRISALGHRDGADDF